MKRNPYAVQSRLKARVLLKTYDARFARAALPVTEQLARPDILTSFQAGHVSVTSAPGAAVPEDALVRTSRGSGPGGGAVAVPSSGGAVVTSVPPVSSSRPAAPAAPVTGAPAAPGRPGGLEEAPPWFPADVARRARARADAPPGGQPGSRGRLRPTPAPTARRPGPRHRLTSQPFHFGTKSVGAPAPPPAAGMNFRSSPTASTPRRSSESRPERSVSETASVARPFSTQ